MTEAELQHTLIEDLASDLSDDEMFDEDRLAIKVKAAIRDVKRRRNYKASSYTEDEIWDDVEDYYSTIRNVALYDYNSIGAEFESYHYESNINRSFIDREKLFYGVAPFAG